MSDKSAQRLMAVPQGGGALKGIGETFSPDLFTGTGNFVIPLQLPAARNGLQPAISLTYSTGHGNSPFGLGWSLSVPGVTRKTSKGVPRYDDAADVFVLSGFEDLVQIDAGAGVAYFRPRVDTAFARIAHHRDPSVGDDYWTVATRDGRVSVYGTPRPPGADQAWIDPAAISHPSDPTRRFAWKLTETRDTFGNRIQYVYERDAVREDGPHRWDQVYLSEIGYADYGDSAAPSFLVTVKCSYEKRPDPFSEYRPGFEVRTVRRCARIEVWTNAGRQQRVRAYHLTYADQLQGGPSSPPPNKASLLVRFQVEGTDDEAGLAETLPPLDLSYAAFEPDKRVFQPVTGAELPPASLGHPELELVDMFGSGLVDIMEMSHERVRYWRNLGGGRFDRPRPMRDAPSALSLADPGVQLIDADGDGRTDLVVTQPGYAGYFPLTFQGGWDRRSFRRWEVAPTFNLEDPEAKLIDLDGDGVTDLLRSGTQLECYFNHPRRGWSASRRVERQRLEVFPNLSFADPRVQWADMTGDGLTDVVLVLDGRVDYWPALGRGDFAPRVTMRGAPRFPAGYQPRHVLVGDVDGDGAADLVYLGDRKVVVWINQGGNGFSEPIEILGTPAVSDIDAVRLADLLGTGVRGVLWSRDVADVPGDRMFFLDLTGGHKPYLLERMDNSTGAVTNVGYAPSTRFFLADLGTPSAWRTPLPFPVQVVTRLESIDAISGGKLTSEFSYHHGYWDGVEREFQGFGRVDQRDSYAFADYHAAGLDQSGRRVAAVAPRHFSPPTETRSWFRLGPIGEESGDCYEIDYADEFWPGDPPALEKPAEVERALRGLSRRGRREALRGLRGGLVRTELYADDGSHRAARPYTVTERLQEVRIERAPTEEARGVFFPHDLAERSTQWERGPDAMTHLSFTDDYDAHGQPRLQVSVAVPRGRDYRTGVAAHLEPFLATCTTTVYAQRADPGRYLVDCVAHVTEFEIIDDGRTAETSPRPSAAALADGLRRWRLGAGPALRHHVMAQTLSHYDGNDFEGLPLGEIGGAGALKRREELVLTDAVLLDAYGAGAADAPPYFDRGGVEAWATDYPAEFRSRVARLQQAPPTGVAVLGAHIVHEGDAARQRGFFAATLQQAHNHRGVVIAERDPLGGQSTIEYGDGYDLLPTRVIDARSLATTAHYDYRVLQPRRLVDVNGNETEYRYTPLGLLQSVAVLGKPGEDRADTSATPGTTFAYDFGAFQRSGDPIYVHTTRRTHHATDVDDAGHTLETREYSDGFGRVLQVRTRAEDVLFDDVEAGGEAAALAVGRMRVPGTTNTVVNGARTYDNKGRVVESYEPFFSTGWGYGEPADTERRHRTTTIYDPRGRVARTVHPDGSEDRTVFGVPRDLSAPDDFAPSPWERYVYDGNDNGGRTPLAGAAGRSDPAHRDTPVSFVLDALGRVVESVERNGPDPALDTLTTHLEYDTRGNVLRVWDPRGRLALARVYDVAGRPLRVDQLDAGTSLIVRDATGDVIEQRDAKGALVLRARDQLRRQTHLWARDAASEPVTLRERIVHGDSTESGLTRDDARARNLLGKPHRYCDEAGEVGFEVYDFKGNVIEKVRRVIDDAVILAAAAGADGRGWRIPAYRVDWQTAPGETLDQRAELLLETARRRTSQQYDALGRVTRVVFPAGVDGHRRQLTPFYNRAGSLERVLFDGVVFIEHIAYNARGQRTLVAYGDRDPARPGPRVMTRYGYHPMTFRLSGLRTDRFESPEPYTYARGGESLQDLVYDYDLAGNLVALHDRTPGSGVSEQSESLDRAFAYDPLYRLRSATGREHDEPAPTPWDPRPVGVDSSRTRAYMEFYAYDPAGNLIRVEHRLAPGHGGGSTRELAFVSHANRLESMRAGADAYAYEHDAAGNLVRENAERHFEWDHASRLRMFRVQPEGAEPSQHAHYLYDAEGRRVKKLLRKQGEATESTVYVDGIFERDVLTSAGGVQAFDTFHVLDGQTQVATVRVGDDPLAGATPGGVTFADHLGSSALVIDQAGQWMNREEYTPFGQTSFGGFARKRYRFSGQERDGESGLSHHGARYYASWLGRWISPDPLIGLHAGSPYRYVRNNPLRYVDETGLYEIAPYTEASRRTPSEVGARIVERFNDDAIREQVRGKGFDASAWQSSAYGRDTGAGINVRLQPFGPATRRLPYLTPVTPRPNARYTGYTYCVGVTFQYAMLAIGELNAEQRKFDFGTIAGEKRYDHLRRFQQQWYRAERPPGRGAPDALVSARLGYQVHDLRTGLHPGAVVNYYGVGGSASDLSGHSLIFLRYTERKSFTAALMANPFADPVELFRMSGRAGMFISQGDEKTYSFDDLERRGATGANWWPTEAQMKKP